MKTHEHTCPACQKTTDTVENGECMTSKSHQGNYCNDCWKPAPVRSDKWWMR